MSQNRSNVDALVRLLREAPTERGTASIAEFLASCGVLVPAVLKDEEVGHWGGYNEHFDPSETDAVIAAHVREELERIAKGEP